jgi:hypothetical protein
LSIYALLNRTRIYASAAVLSEAEHALASITEQYFSPNLSLEQLHALVRAGAGRIRFAHSRRRVARKEIAARRVLNGFAI